MEELEKWLAAGEAVREALSKALDIVKEGASLLKLAEDLESEILRRGMKLAFPANLSINSVAAHYSPGVGDETIVPERGVVKVDLGAHIDGCIADAAVTIALDPRFDPLVEAAKHALRAALNVIRPGIDLCDVGWSIEAVIKAYGFKPIANLSGHLMHRYNLHAGKHVPNVRSEQCGRAYAGEVYAIEPFATDGAGFVVEGSGGAIYRISSVRSVGDPKLDRLLRNLWLRYKGLPFSERWVFSEEGERGLKGLTKLVQLRRVYRYPVLVEAKRGVVTQFEDTVIVHSDRSLNVTRVLELIKT